jgi:hypothetical protein
MSLDKFLLTSSFNKFLLASLSVAALTVAGRADSVAPFGIASAYNLVALGTVDAHGATPMAGTIST